MKFFRDPQQRNLFLALVLSSLFALAMVLYRLYTLHYFDQGLYLFRDWFAYKGYHTFLFMVWNLFLAWIPYCFAIILNKISVHRFSAWAVSFCLLAWLLFFPNAPYLLTDLLHLKSRSPIPIWYDVLLFMAFVWTGLMLGLASLYEVQLFFRKHFSETLSWLVVGTSIVLCGLGIYIGRFLRWNSWDILTQPWDLLGDIFHLLLFPADFRGSASMLLMSVFLLITYLFFLNLVDGRRENWVQ